MAKPVFKDRKPINSSLRNELWDWLDAYSKKTMIPKSKLLDQAIQLLMDNKRTEQGS